MVVKVAGNGNGTAHRCATVVVATGLSVPNAPETIEGIEMAEGCVQLLHTSTTLLHIFFRLLAQPFPFLVTSPPNSSAASYPLRLPLSPLSL
jgi:hypothetical protein